MNDTENINLAEAIKRVKRSDSPIVTARNLISKCRKDLTVENNKRKFFETAFNEIKTLPKEARDEIYNVASESAGGPINQFNEYVSYASLAIDVHNAKTAAFDRPSNVYSTEVHNSNNPLSSMFSIVRKNSKITDGQFVSILEACYPQAVRGLEEKLRDRVFQMASDRGASNVEIANMYIELAELISMVRYGYDDSADDTVDSRD